jgi:hypothetical protein
MSSYSVSFSAACFQCCCTFSVETSPSTPPSFFPPFSSLVKAPQPWPRPSWALRPARAELARHLSTPRCQAGRLLRVELPEPSTARHRRRSELSSCHRSKPSSTVARPSPELAAASSLSVVHRPISESFVSTLSSALSAELPPSSCSMRQGAKPQLQHHIRNVVVEMLQQRHAPVPSFRPCPSCDLATRKVLVEILQPWAEVHLQW